MALYSKSDMIYHDYSWTVYDHDNPKVTGEPDSTLLNRHEGYEMLYFINKYAQNHSILQIWLCQRIERIIRQQVPSHIHSQREITRWIEENWGRLV
jgi:hypothetical protein